MSLAELRDLVIVVDGIIFTILLIGLAVGSLIVYNKMQKLMKSIKKAIRPVSQMIILFKGIQEAIRVFSRKKGKGEEAYARK